MNPKETAERMQSVQCDGNNLISIAVEIGEAIAAMKTDELSALRSIMGTAPPNRIANDFIRGYIQCVLDILGAYLDTSERASVFYLRAFEMIRRRSAAKALHALNVKPMMRAELAETMGVSEKEAEIVFLTLFDLGLAAREGDGLGHMAYCLTPRGRVLVLNTA